MPEWIVGLALSCEIRDENASEFRQLLRDYLSLPPPHCLSREAYALVGSPDCYQLLERWSEARHLDAHLASNAHRALVGGIRALGTLLRVETLHPLGAATEEGAPSLAHLVIHDLKNPLAGIKAHVTAVREDLEKASGFEVQVDDLLTANAACEHLSAMIQDLLVVSRIGPRQLQAVRAPIGIHELVNTVARAFAGVATARGILLETDTEPAVAPADGMLLRRLLENLVSNAVRHVGHGGRIQLALRSEGDHLRLAVRNTGPAVPDPVLAVLGQGPISSRARQGLGLYLCQLVAQAHGGRIAHVARPGWNVSFEATLPSAEPALGVL